MWYMTLYLVLQKGDGVIQTVGGTTAASRYLENMYLHPSNVLRTIRVPLLRCN